MIVNDRKSILFLVLFINIHFIDVIQAVNCYPRSILYSPCRRDIDSRKPIGNILQKVTKFAGVWSFLLNSNCHPDLAKLLCSIHAPECRKSFRRERRVPCQRMCMDIQIECLPNVSIYGYKWPMEANCTDFPHSDCIDLTNPNESGYYKKYIKSQREGRSSNKTHYFGTKPTKENEKIQEEKMINKQNHPADKEKRNLYTEITSKPTYKNKNNLNNNNNNNNGFSRNNSKNSVGEKSKLAGGIISDRATSNNNNNNNNKNSSTILSDQQQMKRKNREFDTRTCSSCYKKMEIEAFAKEFCKHPIVIRAKFKRIKFDKNKNLIRIQLNKNKSRIMKSESYNYLPVISIRPKFSCTCRFLTRLIKKNRKSNFSNRKKRQIRGKWMLMGAFARQNSQQFNIRTLLKWRHRKLDMKFVLRRLRKNPKKWCKNVEKLTKIAKEKLLDGTLELNQMKQRKKRQRRKRERLRPNRLSTKINNRNPRNYNGLNWNFWRNLKNPYR